ncbi:uncharacterized protein ACMZJ9_018735 isoform 2-T2 [Mantella aurantiaca]
MKNYQIVLPLLALAFAMTFVEKTAALSIRPVKCPEKQVPSCNPCGVQLCSEFENITRICLHCVVGGCICEPRYYFQDGKCVLAEHCKVECPENMFFEDCSRKTDTRRPPIVITDPEEICWPRCVCQPGFVLNPKDNQRCIPTKE